MVKSRAKKILNTVFNEDARKILDVISHDIKVQTTITSPPYYDMKDYGSVNQVGYGQTYEDYLEDLQSIFKGVFDITEDDGTLWIVIDTFKRNNQVVTLPFDLSNKFKEIGWLLQDVIIWKKDKTVPWSNNGFMQRKFEYILFFSKSTKFKSNKDSVRIFDTTQLKKWWVKYPERYNPKGKALDEVWEFPIPIQGSWGSQYIRHFCPLPKEMVATMIQISTDENDIILDPFAGTGTVLSQSAYMNRNYLGFELNQEYIKMFQTYLKKTLKKSKSEYLSLVNNENQSTFEEKILNLRALKYGRLLVVELQKIEPNLKIFINIKGASKLKNKIVIVEYEIIGAGFSLEDIEAIIINKPFTQFGIEPVFKFSKSKKLLKSYYGYTKTNSYSYVKDANLSLKNIPIISKICVDLNENDYL